MATMQIEPLSSAAANLTADETALLRACAKCPRGIPAEEATATMDGNATRAAFAIESLLVRGFVETPVVQPHKGAVKVLIGRKGLEYAAARDWAIWGNRAY